MQTFLPFPDFEESVRTLKRQHLGKQRVETYQIIIALLEGRGWVNHTATRMWAGYERALLEYQQETCFEWVRRGYRDTCFVKTSELYYTYCPPLAKWSYPYWLGDNDLHYAYQSNLLRKDFDHYEVFFPNVPDDLEYVWPTRRSNYA